MEYVVVQRGLSYRNASIQLKNSREEEEWREYKSSIIFKEVLFFWKKVFKEVCPTTEMRVYGLKPQGRRNGGSTNEASYSYLVIGPNLAYRTIVKHRNLRPICHSRPMGWGPVFFWETEWAAESSISNQQGRSQIPKSAMPKKMT